MSSASLVSRGKPRRWRRNNQNGETKTLHDTKSPSGGSTNSGSKTIDVKPRLTHFIALPIGHHAELRQRVSSFASALVDSSPPIQGLHESMFVSPRRIHLTLGVMSLRSSLPSSATPASGAETNSRQPSTEGDEPCDDTQDSRKTLEEAKTFLDSLRPQVMDLLARGVDSPETCSLFVPLEHIDIMAPERNDLSRAHVLYAAPLPAVVPVISEVDSENPAPVSAMTAAQPPLNIERLQSVCEFIQTSFMKAGFVVDDKRPLKLHCTLINSIYRKPRFKRGTRRTPFDYDAVLRSAALRSIIPVSSEGHDVPEGEPQSTISGLALGKGKKATHVHPVRADLGTWRVGQIQICEMGSSGPEGEYKSVHAIGI